MTIARLSALLLLCSALPACGQQSAPDKAAQPVASPSPPNAAATQSIMQEEVIAETEPTPVPDATPTPVPLPRVTIGFPAGAGLDDAGRAALDTLLAGDGLPENARFVLRGSSDSMGSDRDNLVTSRRRAEAVRSYLIERGVAADRIEVIALGERRPVAPNATIDGADDPQGRARNRRVDVEVLAPVPETPAAPVEADPATAAQDR